MSQHNAGSRHQKVGGLPLPTIIFALLLSLFVMGAAMVISHQQQQTTTTLKLAHSLNADHPVHQAMVYMGERLESLSGGSMQLDIYLNGQLGNERELIEMLQIGALSMTKVSAISLEGFAEEMKLFSIPYLFKDKEHYWRVLNGELGHEMLNSIRSVQLQGLGYYDAGSRSFYTKTATVNTPSDLDGKKIRVLASRTSIEMVEALGGAATPIAWGELYTALQQGVVDGAENNPPSYYLSKHYETAPFYSLDEHTSVPDLIIMSRPVFEQLSQQQRDWLQQAVSESVTYQRQLWATAEADALSALKAAGVTIHHPDKTPFRKAVAPLQAQFSTTSLAPLIAATTALENTP